MSETFEDKSNNNDAELSNKANLEECKQQATQDVDENSDIKSETGIDDHNNYKKGNDFQWSKMKEFLDKIAQLEKEKDVLIKDRDSTAEDRDAITKSLSALEKKYTGLTSKLHDQIECPVCLEFPTSGPIYSCPNGHLVCSNCKDANCPTCRGKMFNGKSLLAVTVMENFEHKCKFEECEEILPLEKYKLHLKSCPHRLVFCPARTAFCGKKMSLNKVYDHISKECEGSWNHEMPDLNYENFPVRLTHKSLNGPPRNSRGFALRWEDVHHLYLHIDNVLDFTVFSVQLFGDVEQCKKFTVEVAVYRLGDEKNNYVQKLTSEPLPIDIDQEIRKQNGLTIGSIHMEKIARKQKNGDEYEFGIGVDVKRSPDL